jgi:hypothetical protein
MSPRIILLNFTKKESDIIAKAGYSVERGFMGVFRSGIKDLPFQTPHPLYEYDILFYKSQIAEELEKEFVHTHDLLRETGSYQALASFATPPRVRISFIGESTGMKTLLQGGVFFIDLQQAEANVSSFVETPKGGTFGIEKVHNMIANFKGQIAHVEKFFVVSQEKVHYPFNLFPVLLSRSGFQVAGYGTSYDRDTLPRYIALPELKNTAQAVIEILACLETTLPRLFPDKAKRQWLYADGFLLPEERRVQSEIEAMIAETKAFIEVKKKERQRLADENSFVRNLLVATENQTGDDRLSTVVRKALEFLDFNVTDIDEKTKSAIKKEDFWVEDGTFFAITEVTGTISKNPKVKEYNDILGRVTTIYKRKTDLKLPDGVTVSGLLVLNYDIETHPAKRPRVYTGELEHIVESAVEQGIGLLSTVELHRIVMAVKEGSLTKDAARATIRKAGRIEYHARRPTSEQEAT